MTRNQKYYQRGKARARDEAIEWQFRFEGYADDPLDPFSLDEWAAYFRRIGRRFGLLREFRENAII